MVAQSDWLPMMIATGLAVMRALSPAARKARMYRNPPLGGKPIRLVNLVDCKVPLLRVTAGLGRDENGRGNGGCRKGAGGAALPRGLRRAPAGPRRDRPRRDTVAQRSDGA